MATPFEQIVLREVTERGRSWEPASGERESIQYIDVSAVSRDDLAIQTTVEHSAETAPSRARKVVRAGDTIFATIRPGLKRIAMVPPHLDDAIASTAFCVIRPRVGRLDPHFLFFAVSHDAFVRGVEDLETGASYPAVRDGDILNQHIPFPPLPEQILIARILNTTRRAMLLETAQFTHSVALKRAAMRELFTRGLRGEPQKQTDIGPVPESWRIKRLNEIARLERGRFMHRPRNEPRFYGGSMPFVQTGDVVRSGGRIREFTQTLNEDGVAISRVFPAGTILITIAANIGYTGILQFESACPDSLIAITPIEEIETRFLEYYLQTQRFEMDRSAPKGTQKNINIQFLNRWPVSLPCLDEQREIVDVLDAIDRKIDLHKRKRAVLDDLFRALLHKLMTGEIRVADLDLPALVEGTA